MIRCGKCKREIRDERNVYSHPKKGLCHKICGKRPRKSKQGRIAKPKAQRFVHRGGHVDLEATARAGFKDPRSKVDVDGAEFLGKKDWVIRKKEIFERDGGVCQWIMDTESKDLKPCGKPAVDVHHWDTRGEGGGDEASNLQCLCREHHNEAHPEKQTQFRASRRAPGVGEGKR